MIDPLSSASDLRRKSSLAQYFAATQMSERRGIHYDNSPKKRIRIGVNQILTAAFALTSIAIFASCNLYTSVEVSSSSSPSRLQGEVGGSDSGINNNSVDSLAGANSFHFIVSSDCTSYQRWETLTQLHSAQSVRQCGRFTWIVSGWCVPLFWPLYIS
jgi:hypothetical protein